MSKKAIILSPAARATLGALIAYIGPRMATDAKLPDFKPALKDVTLANYGDKTALVHRRVEKMTRGLLATDADIGDLTALLDALEDSGAMEGQDSEEDPNTPAPMEKRMAGMDDHGGLIAKIKAHCAQHMPPEAMSKLDEMIGEEMKNREEMGSDAEMDDAYDAACNELGRDETPEETEKREEAKSAADAKKRMGRDETEKEAEDRRAHDKMGRDRRMGRDAKRANDAKGRLGRDETPEEMKERRKEERAEDRKRMGRDEPPPFKGRPETGGTMTKDEVDKMVKQATDSAIQGQRAISEAEKFIKPWVGELTPTLAFDSAEAVHRAALEALGVDHKEIHASALKTVLTHIPKPQAKTQRELMATDAKPVAKSFDERFAGVQRIGVA